ncbi:MAG TPA: hypothetical protein VFP31_11285 [Gaiellaceae bacterium]|nr:hypothetical protein [Gaiellaceae bacterium]
MVGRASAVLTPRLVAGLALLGALLAYYALFRHGPNLPTTADVLFVAFVLIPAVFALVWVALPLRRWRGLLGAGIALAVLAVVASRADLEVVANFAKLGAATAVAFWFLGYFESALWVALVALMIPIVDSYSVWRGPTHHIISERPEVFSALSFSFPLPGERQVFIVWREPLAGPRSFDVYRTPGGKRNDEPLRDENDNGQVGFLEAELDADRDYTYRVVTRGAGDGSATIVARGDAVNKGEQHGPATSSRFAPTDLRADSVDSSAKLGLPDLLFFALFLGAADRFRLRVRATWLAMTLSFGLTLAGTYFFDVSGLPALPLLALGFLLANADLLWRAFRAWRREGRAPRAPEAPAHRESAGEDPPP